MKRGTESKLKFKQLQQRLGLTLWQAKGLLQTFWDFVSDNAPAGNVGRYTDQEIAFGIDWTDDPAKLIAALIDTHWIDADTTHRLVVHDWPDHCEDTIHTALARKGELFVDGSQPRMSRLNKRERRKVQESYEGQDDSDDNDGDRARHAARHASPATRASASAARQPLLAARALPSPAKPSLAKTLPLQVPRAAPQRPPDVPRQAAAGVSTKQQVAGPGGGRPSIFADLTTNDLRDTAKLLAWLQRASNQKWPVVSKSDSDRLWVLAAAERSLEVGREPVKVFAKIVGKGLRSYATKDHEDRARHRLREYFREGRTSPPPRRVADRDAEPIQMASYLRELLAAV